VSCPHQRRHDTLFAMLRAPGNFTAAVRRVIRIGAPLLALCAPAYAQRLPITYYSPADGLPHYVVNRIVRDGRGFMWFCTRDGLARFDGREFVTWGVDEGLPSGEINDLLETPDGIFWIATQRGLVRFDPRGAPANGPPHEPGVPRMFTTYVPAPQDPRAARISYLQRDRSGALWVGTASGLFRADVAAGGGIAFTTVDLHIPDVLQARAIGALLVDRFGALWIGTGFRLLRRAPDGRIDTLAEADGVPSSSITRIVEDRSGAIWFTPLLGGLFQVANDSPEARPRVARHLTPRDSLSTGGAFDLLLDTRGVLWLGTSRQLVRIVPERTPANGFSVQPVAEREGLRAHQVSALVEDPDGNIWAAVNPYGAAKLARTGFTTFTTDDAREVFMTMVETRSGGLVAFSQKDSHISGYRFDGQALARIPGGQPRVSAGWAWNQMALEDRAGGWWFGGKDGVIHYKPGVSIDRMASARPAARYTSAEGLAADTVIRLFEDQRANLWIATVGHGVSPNGLSLRRAAAAEAFVHFSERDGLPRLDRFYVSSFASDRAGNVWIGFSGDAGLVRYDGADFVRFTSADGVPPGQIRNMMLDSRGRLWAATYRGGICRIEQPESAHPTIRAYTAKDGLSSNETTAIVEASPDELYIGTARGIDRLKPSTGEFTHLTVHDGELSAEMLSALRDRTGALWFVYSDNIVRMVPAPAVPVPPPAIFISGVQIDGWPQPIAATGEPHVEGLRLPGNASLRLDVTAPWFGGEDELLYQYRLHDRDPWSPPMRQRTVTYAGLAPAHYSFATRAVTSGGASQATARMSFTVVAPVWRRSWFLLLIVATAAMTAYGLFRRRLTRLLEVANMRTRIATDLHGDIGANLTRIAVLSEVARRRYGYAADVVDDPLTSIATLSRESVGSMADIVWAISPGRDRVDDLVRKMREHAEDLLAVSDVRLTFRVDGAPPDDRIGLDVRRGVFLIFKEAVTNAARHSRCTAVDVLFTVDGRDAVLGVSDDGIGFDRSGAVDGNGLMNMRRRAERIGGALRIDSRAGGGTTVRLDVPLKPRRRALPV
jgi:ligand-binding sensor domain-containing protein/signal transduction histidine kinase